MGRKFKQSKKLVQAASDGNLEIVTKLISTGLSVNYRQNAALRLAAANGHVEVVRILLENGANINHSLIHSASDGDIEVVKLLHSFGADLNTGNGYPLFEAILEDNFDTANYLIDNGADINLSIKGCDTRLYCECCEHHRIIEKNILKQYKREINLYIGIINEKTELHCGICEENFTNYEKLYKCHICNKCVHMSCQEKWNDNCVYCRS